MTTMKETATALGETVLAAKSAVQDLGRSATNAIDQARTDAAAKLHTAASAVRSTANKSASMIEDCAEGAGHRLDSTSSYLDKHDAGDMLHDLRRIVRRHPGPVLLLTASVAACVGYWAASNKSNRRG
jgi:hypothetical protein